MGAGTLSGRVLDRVQETPARTRRLSFSCCGSQNAVFSLSGIAIKGACTKGFAAFNDRPFVKPLPKV